MKSVKLKIKKIRELMNETKFKREYKFRAWDSKIKKMFYSNDCYFSFIDGKLIERDGENGSDEDSQIIMLYTGLKDQNGKEIYEGDILKNQYGDYKIVKYKTEVIENCGCCDNISVIGYDFSNFWYDGKEIEIIGNKYENPELLEKIK